jgi:hypothetical protein
MSKLCLGSLCVLFEDLGFKFRDPPERDDIKNMTYHYHTDFLFEKIFADINKVWVLEVCLVPDELHIDRWERKPNGLFLVEDELTIDLYNPKSIKETSSFVLNTIEIAHASD